jgi:hypothetical protein
MPFRSDELQRIRLTFVPASHMRPSLVMVVENGRVREELVGLEDMHLARRLVRALKWRGLAALVFHPPCEAG